MYMLQQWYMGWIDTNIIFNTKAELDEYIGTTKSEPSEYIFTPYAKPRSRFIYTQGYKMGRVVTK